MATYDNKIWLLKNIRDAFIATDDTGLCEIVMASEDFSKIFQNKAFEDRKRIREGKLSQPSTSKGKEGLGDIAEDDDEKEIVTQFDPYPDIEDSDDDDMMCDSYIRYDEFGGHRQRSNTAQWLDKKEQALKKAAKIKVMKWDDTSTQLTSEQIAEIFSRMEVRRPEKFKSLLAEQLEKCPDLPHRQYLEYAKFDGTAQLGLPTKCFKIFMTMLPEKHQNYPLVVCVIASAKIKDLIGFTCYKYSIEHPDITLGSVHDYGLCIAEDDGEVDWAFPCLDANEPCSKFGFSCLGLIDLKSKSTLASQPISLPEDGMLEVFPKAIESGHSQHNPSRHNTGGSATSEAVRKAIKAVNEERRGAESELDKIQSHLIATEAPQYKTYRVHLLRKVRTNTPVQLGVCLERIEVEPLVANKHAFWSKSKYFRLTIDSVAWCQILEARATKTTFRIVHSPTHSSGFLDRSIAERRGAESELDKIQSHLIATEAPQYKTYRVHLLRKVRTNTPVQLGVCLERIEVEPLVANKHAFWSKSKYFRLTIDSVAWCQILEARATKTTFRIVHSPTHSSGFLDRSIAGNPPSFFHSNTAYKIYDFECDHETAREIVDKVNAILDLRNSPCRREYKTSKEKKLQTRRSFHPRHLS